MLILFVTHASAARTPPRCLTPDGCSEAQAAAHRIRELLPQEVSITSIISSPAARCLQTVLIVAEEMSKPNMIHTNEINTQRKLGEIDKGPMTAERLKTVIEGVVDEQTGGLLVSTHGDLGSALPSSQLIDGWGREGWFERGPVIAAIDYEKSRPWSENKVIYCQEYSSSGWRSLVRQ